MTNPGEFLNIVVILQFVAMVLQWEKTEPERFAKEHNCEKVKKKKK